MDNFLRQLTEEVHSRLTDIKRRGKCVTLKYMVRSQDAPIETAKFMGHGLCDHITKSTTLNEFTSNFDLILKTVFSIKKTLNIAPSELRGIGIQISKFDEINEPAMKTNILKTMFEKVQAKKSAEKNIASSKGEDNQGSISDRVLRNSPNKKPNGQMSRRGRGKGQGKGRGQGRHQPRDVSTMFSTKSYDVDTCSQFNLEILNELPEEIREEVLKDYKQSKTKSKKSKTAETNQIDPEFLAALPFDIQEELLKHHSPEKSSFKSPMKTVQGPKISTPVKKTENTELIPEDCETLKTQISEENFLVKSEWRRILKSWLDSSEKPLTCDIEIVAKYSVELIHENQLNNVYVCLRYLHR